MLTVRFQSNAAAAALAFALSFVLTTGARARVLDDPPTGAGTLITNRAQATYQDDSGANFTTVSPTISVTVLAVSALVVTPDETQPSASVAPRERVTRVFQICNTGNTPDAYTLTRAEISAPASVHEFYFDADNNGVVSAPPDTLARLNETASPQVAPGACLNVLAVVDTGDVAPQSTLTMSLTARSNNTTGMNGMAEDAGTIINAVGNSARLTDPNNTSLPPSKLVENRDRTTAATGQTLNYSISFRNSGGVVARQVLLSDELPTGLEYVAGTLQLAGRTLSDAADADEGAVVGRRIEVRLAQVAVDQLIQINYQARITDQMPSGAAIINTANLSGENFTATNTSDAVVVVDPFGVVYAGHSGGTVRIGDARVSLLTDQAGNPLQLPPDVGFAPNEPNVNPFSTDGQGRFAFALTPAQLGTPNQPARYYVNVTAPGYRGRLLEISLRPAGGVFEMTVRALDGQPLARAGSFALADTETVLIEDIASIALNIPLFEVAALEITKTADKQTAEVGDLITYRVAVRNATASPMSDVVVRDQLPPSFHYVEGTGRIETGRDDARNLEPEITADGQLNFRLGQLDAGASVTLVYRVRVGANAQDGDQFNSAVASGLFPSGERATTPAARAGVRVGRGVFSTRQFIIGRVFEDKNNNGQFDAGAGERPVAGVRLYLNNGQSVITDSAGQYNIPSIGEGAFVISLDPVTVPDGYLLADEGRRAGRSWTRLLRTPLGGGALLRQNFALVPPAEGGETGRRDAASSSLISGSGAQAAEILPAPGADARVIKTAADGNGNPALSAAEAKPRAVGTFETAAPDYVEPVAPGEVVVAQPAAEEVIMSPALSVAARVTENWAVALEVNGERVNDSHIGERRLDHKNKISTFTFVGLNLRPGPNRLKATAISPEGTAARSVEQTVYGRGPARRLEIVPAKREVQAGGRDATLVTVRAFDQWGHPAADASIAVQTSAGRLLIPGADKAKNGAVNSSLQGEGANAMAAISAEQINQNSQQQMAQLAGGEAVVELVSDGAPATAKLHASAGEVEADGEVRIIPELRPALLVGLAEISIGRAAPEISMRGEEGNFRSRLAFYYRGQFFGQNLLTLAYDSQRPLNRTAGRDRLFQLDPLERVYPLFGDSSTRFEDAQSNSKLYVRLDRGRSYAMFGDFDADLQNAGLANYARNLTGVKLHAENANGDFVTVTGARPDTAFARDVLPGGFLSLQRLSHFDILPGSEIVTLEARDRRNPEIILSRQTLARSVDYNLNAATGEIFFLRPISAFDYELNLLQTVVTYEYRANDLSSAVYTARAQKRFGKNLQLGLSFVDQRQADLGSFLLGGVDGEWTLPRRGKLQFAWAMSRGRVAANGNVFNTVGDGEHNGQAYRVELEQPLPFHDSVLRANFSRSDEDFLNPFGQTVTPGAQRAGVSLDLRPRSSRVIRFQLLDERNRTANVDNERITAGLSWNEVWTDRLRTFFAYDFRRLNDELSERDTTSNLITAGVEYRPTDKLELSVKREQNLGESDPTYPNQTTLAASYQFNQQARLFFTQRLASAPIVPIADVANTGFAATSSRRETAIGVETQLGRYTSMTGRYQLENGINGTDSFAVIGLQNRLPLSKVFSLDLQYERGFHLAGQGESFNSGGVGLSWQPTANFRSSARYELRDRNGLGQLLTIGAAGKLGDGVTALAQMQMGRAVFDERGSSSFNGTAAISFRPLESDRAALLFSYTRRALAQDATTGRAPTRDRSDTLSSDGLYQLTKDLELYGRFALRFSGNGDQTLAFASALTYLGQGRAQYRLSRYFDLAGEVRMLAQPSSHTRRLSSGAELGFWALPDLRLGGGYNFTSAIEPNGPPNFGARRGFYFTISSKLSNLFDLFGTSRQGLAAGDARTDARNSNTQGDGGQNQ